ncbi:MAG TPA: hypothetical protein ENG74_03635 [Thermoplasmatales archaeon]|nr:hypothetical protein [Thermoplasmatales archaeon]
MRINHNRFAVVGVIEAILLIALFAIILSTIQLVYIPEVMKNREAEHMDKVADQFSQLKLSIDLHTVTRTNFSISVPITLGSRELPYFITARALGDISIKDDEIEISIKTATSYTNLSLGIIEYDARNAYFVDQSYILECGAVILEQDEGLESMLVPPTLSVTTSGTTVSIDFLVINITGYANRTTESGLGVTFVRTNFSSISTQQFSNIESLTIYTSHTNSWFNFLNYTFDSSTANITLLSNGIRVEPKAGYTMNLDMDVAKIYAQVGLGWIGNL